MTPGILLFILAILVIIMVHEAGHFTVAKLFGFKAPKFFVGFGPTLWSVTRGETEYGVKALPFGGFVKIIGMNPYEEIPPADRSRSYPNKPRWQRALLLLGGPATHWPLAFVLYLVTAMTLGYPTGEVTTEVSAVDRIEVENGVVDTPAIEAGIEPGDRIVAVGGRPVSSWNEVQRYIRTRRNGRGTFTIRSDGDTRVVEVELATAIFRDGVPEPLEYAPPGEDIRAPGPEEDVRPFLGIAPLQRFETLGFTEAVADSGGKVGALTVGSVQGIGMIFGSIFSGDLFEALSGEGTRDPTEGPVGIVGISRIAGETFQRGQLLNFVHLVGTFIIFIGIMNLLPLPPLDGGHLAVVGYEALTGNAVDMRKVIPVAAAVISFFVVLTIAALYLDIVRPVQL